MKPHLYRAWENNIYRAIRHEGRDVTINYYSSVYPCPSCDIDPFSNESTNPNCATCDGTGYYKASDSYVGKGIINTHIGNKRYVYYGNEILNIIPEGEARLTMWLPDILTNIHSSTGQTYLDSAYGVTVDGYNYSVKNTQRVGIDELKVCVATLERIK